MLIRPRFNEYHDVFVPQAQLDYAIPYLDEDIPLYLDPFLLWKSPSLQDKSLHRIIVDGFNTLGQKHLKGKSDEAMQTLIAASECEEVGFGSSKTRVGRRVSKKVAGNILNLFERIPKYRDHGVSHIEEVQLLVDGVSKDRISDLACTFIKSFLIDFTIDQAERYGLPTGNAQIENVYCIDTGTLKTESREVPLHPENGQPLLFVPKRWLRHVPWISYDTYFKDYCPQDDIAHEGESLDRVRVLQYNRDNYGVVEEYIKARQLSFEDCKNDPLFKQIPIVSARRKLSSLKKLQTGKTDNADIEYEKAIGVLLPSMLYPDLDFAEMQSRTDSGVSIRDLIFYNSREHVFLKEIFDDYGSRQIVMEMKNVQELNRTHVDQLNRYLTENLGKFGVFVTRHPPKKAIRQRMIDLWSGDRKAIIVLTDQDIELMVQLFDQKQRDPIDVLKKKYVEFRRMCPG